MPVRLDASSAPPSHYGLALLEAFCVLALVGGIAFFALRFLQRRGLLALPSRRLELEARLPIDLKNSLVIVQVEGRRLLLALADGSPARLVAELEAAREAQPSPAHAEPFEAP
jgi:flagellar biogenesis protein FliO